MLITPKMQIKNNTRSPLLNRSEAGLYPPGSTIKMAIALAALENDIINFNTNFFCKGVKEFGNMTQTLEAFFFYIFHN